MSYKDYRPDYTRLNLIVLPPLVILLPIPLGTSIPLRRKPIITIGLVWANILIFVFTRYSGHFEEILLQYGYSFGNDRILTLFTHLFLHGGYLHLFSNMLFLWIYGANVEDRMGRSGFLAFYLACGIAAVYTFAHTSSEALADIPMVGASGAVFGVMGAFLVLYPLEEIRFFFIVMFLMFFWRFFTFPVAALFIAPLYFLFNLMMQSVTEEVQVAFMAHVGGFLFAMPCALFFRYLSASPKPPRPAEIQLEEEKPRRPLTEQEYIAAELKDALVNHFYSDAIALYREGTLRFNHLPLASVDLLLLAEGMIHEKEFRAAAEVFKEIGKDQQLEDSIRVRAGMELGRLYRDQFGDIPRAVRIYRKLLEKFPGAPQNNDVRRELRELESIGVPPVYLYSTKKKPDS